MRPPPVSAQGAYLIGKGINYRAVLETALDIAKGMLHLHMLDLVHSDLKASIYRDQMYGGLHTSICAPVLATPP